MARLDREDISYFSQPTSQIFTMLVIICLVAGLGYLAFPSVGPVFLANPYFNGVICSVFAVGVIACFIQLTSLMRSVQWIEGFAQQRIGHHLVQPPQMLAPLAALLRQKGARLQLGSASTRSILDSVASRIDEQRDLTRFISNMLIFLGLLGTFYGLATTVPALVATIQSLTPADGEDALDIFARLQSGLEGQLDGMGVAFASSLLGLAGSLVVGLLELFAGRGQNRFYGELEEWLSSITRVGFAMGDGEGNADQNVLAAMMDQMSEQMDGMNQMYAEASAGQADVEARLIELTETLAKLTRKLDTGQTEALERVAAGQEQLVSRLQVDGGSGGIDAESRARLRSIDVQMLRILEEISEGRQESITELRTDLANMSKALHAMVHLVKQSGGQGS
ncbi:MAG: biopolymer transporter ExbB [Pseudomonadota bacterium]